MYTFNLDLKKKNAHILLFYLLKKLQNDEEFLTHTRNEIII